MYQARDYINLSDGVAAHIIEHVIPAGGSSNLMGLPFGGKSFLILQAAEAVANPTRHTFMGFPVLDHGLVGIFQFDTPRQLWSNRVRDLENAGLDFRDVWFQDRFGGPPAFNILKRDHYDWLKSEISSLPAEPKVLFFDVMRELHRGPEDSSDHMQRVLDGLQRAADPAALFLVSHTRKPTWAVPRDVQDESMDENRGSNALNGRVDTSMKLTRNYLYMESRTIARNKTRIMQGEHGLWRPLAEDEEADETRRVVPRPLPLRAQARRLAKAEGIKVNTALGRLRRKPPVNRAPTV